MYLQPNIRSVALTALLLSAVFTGCSSDNTPQAPQPGTPAFKWSTAKKAFQRGDFIEANTLLMQLSQGKSEFAEQARPLALMTSLSMASAYMELSEKFAEGAKRTRGSDAPFMRTNFAYRSQATASAMEFLQEARRFTDANKDKEVALPLAIPAVEADDPPQSKKIASGQNIPASEIQGLESAVIAKMLAKNMTAAGGAAAGEVKVPGPKFLMVLSQGLYNVSEMFGAKKLSQPNRIIEATHDEALEALAMVKDSKEARDLEKKITAAKKKLPKST